MGIILVDDCVYKDSIPSKPRKIPLWKVRMMRKRSTFRSFILSILNLRR